MSYASHIEEINTTRRKINISVEASSVQEALNTITTDMQSTAEIKGFRKGKAPLAMIRKFYMNDIVKKAADKIINDAYTTTIKSLDFQIVSHPHIEPENQFTETSEFKFSATVDINPKLEMTEYQNLSIKLPEELNVKVDEQFEKLLVSYEKKFGNTEDIQENRAAVKGDHAKISYSIHADGKELENKTAANQIIEIDHSIFPEIEKALIGCNAGETRVVSVQVPESYRDAELKGKTVEFHITLNNLVKLIPCERDDELAKKLGYTTMEIASAKILENVKRSHDELKLNAAFEQIVDQILAKNEFEVADSLVESTIDRAIEESNATTTKEAPIDAKNKDARENFRTVALKNVRGILALGHIARQEGVTVTDDEVFSQVIDFALSNGVDPRQFVKQGSKMMEEFRGQVLIQKVVNKLLDLAQIEYTKKEEK